MNKIYPELNQRILEMAEGDQEFKAELTAAIYDGLLELKMKYSEGLQEKNELKIQQIRHKIKPTIAMFEFGGLTDSLNEGKGILESEGFGTSFETHFKGFLHNVEIALSEVSLLKN